MGISRNLYKSIISSAIFLFLALPIAAQEKPESKTPSKPTNVVSSVSKTTVLNSETSANQSQKQTDYVRPDSKARFNRYIKNTVGITALGRTAINAGISTWRNSPEEWGTKWEGFGKRFASNLGRRAISNTTSYALDEAFKLDSSFYRSQNKKFSARLGNALISTVTARNKDGKRVFGLPRIAGVYASNIIAAETWYPNRYDYKDGLKSGTISLGTSALINIFRSSSKNKFLIEEDLGIILKIETRRAFELLEEILLAALRSPTAGVSTFVVEAVRILDDILTRMQSHQNKKRAMLRNLHLAERFFATFKNKREKLQVNLP